MCRILLLGVHLNNIYIETILTKYMPKKRVFVSRKIPESGISLLKKYFEVRVYSKEKMISRKELIKGVKWGDGLLCLLTDKIDSEILDANPNLKVVANYAVGFNNIDVKYAEKKRIIEPNSVICNNFQIWICI